MSALSADVQLCIITPQHRPCIPPLLHNPRILWACDIGSTQFRLGWFSTGDQQKQALNNYTKLSHTNHISVGR